MDKSLVEHFDEPAMNLCLYGFLCIFGLPTDLMTVFHVGLYCTGNRYLKHFKVIYQVRRISMYVMQAQILTRSVIYLKLSYPSLLVNLF